MTHTITVGRDTDYKRILDWVFRAFTKGVEVGEVDITISLHDEIRTIEQNKKQWAIYTDFSKQIQWHGKYMDPIDWKDLLSHEYQAQKIVPALSGGFCVIGLRTSKLKKREMSDLIELVHYWGAELGVKWSDESLKEFETYREVQNK